MIEWVNKTIRELTSGKNASKKHQPMNYSIETPPKGLHSLVEGAAKLGAATYTTNGNNNDEDHDSNSNNSDNIARGLTTSYLM